MQEFKTAIQLSAQGLTIQYQDLQIDLAIYSVNTEILVADNRENFLSDPETLKFILTVQGGSEVLLRSGKEIIYEFEMGRYAVFLDKVRSLVHFERSGIN